MQVILAFVLRATVENFYMIRNVLTHAHQGIMEVIAAHVINVQIYVQHAHQVNVLLANQAVSYTNLHAIIHVPLKHHTNMVHIVEIA